MNEQEQENLRQILASPSYLPADQDLQLLSRDDLRPVRMQLELLKPELALTEEDIASTIVVFGGTQVVEPEEAARRVAALSGEKDRSPVQERALARARRIETKSHYYTMARDFARLVAEETRETDHWEYVVVTGGGPGIMEAANRGAYDAGAKSIGFNITLPHEQQPNPYITPYLCFQFRYFALRKLHFLLRARALVIFPGGFGTLDELFDALTLRQTGRMQEIPLVMVGKEYWSRVIDFEFLADEGVIADAHLDLIQYAESAEEIWRIIAAFHRHGTTLPPRNGGDS